MPFKSDDLGTQRRLKTEIISQNLCKSIQQNSKISFNSTVKTCNFNAAGHTVSLEKVEHIKSHKTYDRLQRDIPHTKFDRRTI
jgi:hypothetical protein